MSCSIYPLQVLVENLWEIQDLNGFMQVASHVVDASYEHFYQELTNEAFALLSNICSREVKCRKK